jgi:hypothetical protein
MELLHIAEGAQELGISYPTLKQMILRPATNRNKASASPSGRKNASAVRRRNAVARGKA